MIKKFLFVTIVSLLFSISAYAETKSNQTSNDNKDSTSKNTKVVKDNNYNSKKENRVPTGEELMQKEIIYKIRGGTYRVF